MHRVLLWLFLTEAAFAASPLEDPKRPVATTPALSLRETAMKLQVPSGFRVEPILGEPDLVQPVAYTIDDRGRLWVVENVNYPKSPGEAKDRILVLEDTQGKGRFDRTTVFWDKATFSSGIAVGFGGVWLGAPPNLLYLPIEEGDAPKLAGEPQILLDGWAAKDTHETLNGFIWGPDGWLYGTHGVFNASRVGVPGTPEKDRVFLDAGVWRFHPQKKVFEVWCEGASNQWGVDWNDRGEAFFEACVIPHMWHAIPGARYQRQAGAHPEPHTYEDIKTIAWGRYEKAAYCGAMVYLGDAFPAEWRDTFFFFDIHMNKLRCEQMLTAGSGYRSEKKADFLVSHDPWFRGLSPQYGPDGGVFFNDWYDRVPCHQQAQYTDRHNGRIYKVVSDAVKPVRVNLSEASDAELVGYQLHRNDWYVRHARRLLQERGKTPETTAALEAMLLTHEDDTRQLRALWALQSQGALTESTALRALEAASEFVRGWTVTCVLENGKPSPALYDRISTMARSDASPVVRRRIASAAQRLPLPDRWNWIEPLAANREDAKDHNLPLLNWYAIEPAVAAQPERGVELALSAAQDRLPGFIARRLAAAALEAGQSGPLEALCAGLSQASSTQREAMLTGMAQAFQGQSRVTAPPAWEKTSAALAVDPSEAVRNKAREIAVLFGGKAELEQLRAVLTDSGAAVENRKAALVSLAAQRDAQTLSVALDLVTQAGPLRPAAFRALTGYDDPRVPEHLVALLPDLTAASDRQDAMAVLTARPAGVKALLAAIDGAKVEKAVISAPLARTIQGYQVPAFDTWLEKNWGSLKSGSAEKRAEIARYKTFLGAGAIGGADVKRGQELFRNLCGICHQMFGTGGEIGPHLPGGFADLDYLLENILDPNAAIGKDYQLVLVTTTDGALQAGIVAGEDANAVTLKVPGLAEPVTIAKNQIKTREVSPNSLMPEGLLNGLQEPDVRNLFLYLRQTQEIP